MSVSTPGPNSLPAPSIPQVNPYGVDVAIGADGDFVVNSSGSLTLVAGPYNCAQAISLRFRTAVGDLPFHPDYGSGLLDMVGSKLFIGGLVAQGNSDLQTMLSEDARFSSAQISSGVSPASPNYQGTSAALGVTAVLVGGESITLQNVTDPSPSDVSLPQAVDPSVDPTLTYDPTTEQEFFANDSAEMTQLQDLDTLQAIVNDIPGASILGTGG